MNTASTMALAKLTFALLVLTSPGSTWAQAGSSSTTSVAPARPARTVTLRPAERPLGLEEWAGRADSTFNRGLGWLPVAPPPAPAGPALPGPGLLACPASIAVWNDPSSVIPLANANPSTALPNGNPWCLYSGMHAGDSWMGAWDRVAAAGVGFYPIYTDTGSGYSLSYAVDYGTPTMSRLGTKCSNQFGKSGDWQAWMFSNCGSPVPRSVWRFRSDSVFYATYGAAVVLDLLPVAVVYLPNNPFFQDAYLPVNCGVTVGGAGVWANQSTRANYLPQVPNPTLTLVLGC